MNTKIVPYVHFKQLSATINRAKANLIDLFPSQL